MTITRLPTKVDRLFCTKNNYGPNNYIIIYVLTFFDKIYVLTFDYKIINSRNKVDGNTLATFKARTPKEK